MKLGDKKININERVTKSEIQLLSCNDIQIRTVMQNHIRTNVHDCISHITLESAIDD